MPYMQMAHDVDPAQVLLDALGDLSTVEVLHNQVLVAIYVRPEMTKSKIILTAATRQEDESQGKAGLVVKMGADACKSDAKWKFPDIEVGDWLVFRASDGWAVNVHGTPCRMLDDVNIRMRIAEPDQVW